jgi:hypothetical protein
MLFLKAKFAGLENISAGRQVKDIEGVTKGKGEVG